jgi:sensor c-di-GMP phosphodiesterase-like protein
VCGIAAGSLSYYILTIRLNPGKEILTAIKRGQFYVVYQPVVDAKELKMRGVEVLMRWKHPTMGRSHRMLLSILPKRKTDCPADAPSV